jgi:hypothetical protein
MRQRLLKRFVEHDARLVARGGSSVDLGTLLAVGDRR